MKVAVLGTGMVGRTIAARIAALDHEVRMGTRDPHASRGRDDSPLPAFLDDHPSIALVTFADAARDADLVFNCTSGKVTLSALKLAGADHLAGKVLVDLSNPLDFSGGMPPTLFVSNDDSLGEQVQRAFPDARVVKTLNTVNADLMVHPTALANGAHTIFVSGNDADAKATVTHILRDWFGWEDVIDLGDITTARGTEMALPLWIRLWHALGDTKFAFQIVRES